MPDQIVNNVWGQQATSEFLTLPSGQTCYAKKIGMQEVLAAGMTSELDILTMFVEQEKLQGHKKSDDQKVQDIMKDPKSMQHLILLVDKVVPLIVVQPRVHCHYRVMADGKSTQMLSPEDRAEIEIDSGVKYVYTDQISMDDKMYLFGWTTGQEIDPVSFRTGPADSVEDVGNVQAVQHSSQRSSRRRRR